MQLKQTWTKISKYLGLILFIIGTIDPLEGSVLILTGSLLMALSAYFSADNRFKQFFIYFLMMVFGVFFLFYLSSLGGFGDQYLSWWWSILILPYPLAWLLTIILLVKKERKKVKTEESTI